MSLRKILAPAIAAAAKAAADALKKPGTQIIVYSGVPAIFTGIAIRDAEEIPYSEEELEQRRQQLRQDLDEVTGLVSNLRVRTKAMEFYLNNKNSDIIDSLSKVNEEIRREEMEIREKEEAAAEAARPKEEKEQEKKKKEEKEEGEKARKKREAEEDKINPPRQGQAAHDTDERLEVRVVGLYRRISARCHPDRTKHKRLHELFKRAAKAKKRFDYDELVAIWDEIEVSPSTLLRRLMNEITVLTNQLHFRRMQFHELQKMADTGVLGLYENPNTRHLANIQFRQKAVETLVAARQRLEKLREQNPLHSEWVIVNSKGGSKWT